MEQKQVNTILKNTFGFFSPQKGTKAYGLPWYHFKSGLLFVDIQEGITYFKEISTKGGITGKSITKKKDKKFISILVGRKKDNSCRYLEKNLKDINEEFIIDTIKKALINYDRYNFTENRTLNKKSTIRDFKKYIATH